MIKAKLYRQNLAQKHTLTHSQKEEKGKTKYILFPKPTCSIWDELLSIQVFHRCTYSKLIVEIYSTAPEAAGRDFPFSSLFAQLPGFRFGFGPASACRSPEGVSSSLIQDGVKGAADLGALAHSGQGEGGVQNAGRARGGRGRHDVAPALCTPCILPGKLSLDNGTLAVVGCTQASWWWHQQP